MPEFQREYVLALFERLLVGSKKGISRKIACKYLPYPPCPTGFPAKPLNISSLRLLTLFQLVQLVRDFVSPQRVIECVKHQVSL